MLDNELSTLFLDEEKQTIWMNLPSDYLGGETPRSLIDRNEHERLLDTIRSILYEGDS